MHTHTGSYLCRLMKSPNQHTQATCPEVFHFVSVSSKPLTHTLPIATHLGPMFGLIHTISLLNTSNWRQSALACRSERALFKAACLFAYLISSRGKSLSHSFHPSACLSPASSAPKLVLGGTGWSADRLHAACRPLVH